MEPIPLPSHIHYELLLQILERQTMAAVRGNSTTYQDQVHNVIIALRKAMSQQKQLEEHLGRANIPVDYRWSLNNPSSNHAAPGPISSP